MVGQSTNSRYDVIVVGAGNAALTAALSARQNGARVLVLEKAPQSERGGNSRFSGGIFRFAYDGIEEIKPLRRDMTASEWDLVDVGVYDEDRYLGDLMRVTEGQANRELTQTLIKQSYTTMTWMTDLGVVWDWSIVWSPRTGERMSFNPGTAVQAKNKGVGLVHYLFNAVQQAGIDIAYQAKMIGFLQDDAGHVTGVRIRTPGGAEDVPAGAVILGSGGFEANPEMRARYLGPGWDQVKVRGTRFNTGETLRMALDIGAMPVGHWQGCHATPIAANAAPVGALSLTDRTNRLSYPYSIMVNIQGKRFIDEGEDTGAYTYVKAGRAILTQPRGIAYQIFDSKTVHLIEERYSTGTPIVGDNIREIAQKMSVPDDALEQTIKEFNASVQPGAFDPAVKDGKRTVGINPPKSNWALAIDSPPYTVYPAACGITFTFGGVKIDTEARVRDTEDIPIPGLYATGEITGDFFFHNYPGGTGLMRGAVFGRIGGSNAAAEALGR
ncbi:MAG: FAD-dependent tricarballylate dehydrogenase TcuA [Dehalococcoidia bacterium]|nr:FAD-dependent tricarballylate dehydrogenase TcuA [Dehalococcoidia bacterium]